VPYSPGCLGWVGVPRIWCSTTLILRYINGPCRFNLAKRGRGRLIMDRTGGPSTWQPTHFNLEQVISQPLASSTTSPLRRLVPISLHARLLSTPSALLVCLSVILLLVPISLLLPAARLVEYRYPPSLASPKPTRSRQPPVSRAATALRHRQPSHRRRQRRQRSYRASQRGAPLLAQPH
jgi:hypothetical protein